MTAIEVWTGTDAAALADTLASTSATHLLLLEAPAELIPGALAAVAEALERFPADLVYGDSLIAGTLVERPIFSPLRLREQNYLGAASVFPVEWLRVRLEELGEPNGSIGYHLALTLDARSTVLHLPRTLTSSGTAAAGPRTPVRYPVSGEPLVSIIIPTRGTSAEVRGESRVLVANAVRGILSESTWKNLEFVIVADDATPQSVIDDLRDIPDATIRLVHWSEDFNFSAKINRGAAFARGEYLLLLNDDVDLISPDWIETMLGLVQQPDVGMVGCLLLFADDTVQHGGHLYRASWAGHIAPGWPLGRDDALASMTVTREVSGVTAACALVSADLFWEVGGLSTEFAGNYNDVDFSFKVRGTGRSIVWTPDARLYHYESKTRDATIGSDEIAALRARWGSRLLLDPYWPGKD